MHLRKGDADVAPKIREIHFVFLQVQEHYMYHTMNSSSILSTSAYLPCQIATSIQSGFILHTYNNILAVQFSVSSKFP